jgi:hypothetical protein
MDLNFAEALKDLDSRTPFRVANEARPPGDYLFASLLPERTSTSYEVRSGTMTVRTTMAGMVGMDSPYPPGGQVDLSKFMEESAKIANDVGLPEFALRQLQDMLLRIRAQGGTGNERLAEEALNFLDKVVVQAHLDTMEWLRGQVLTKGNIDWTFNRKRLQVNYGVPSANVLTPRAGNDAYGGSASKFWEDVIQARKILRYNLRVALAHTDTIDAIISNEANAVRVLQQSPGGTVTVRRFVGTTEQEDTDSRYTIQLVAYDREGEIINPADNRSKVVPFLPPGKLIFVGRNQRSGYRVGEGATDDPEQELALGYTHLAPTVEGGGQPGRWARLFTPEQRPYELRGQGVTNGLPVLEAPKKLVIAETELE